MTIRVVLADDHRIIREGLVALLDREPDICIVAEAADGVEAVNATLELRPDLVIADLSMPKLNGIEAIRRILDKMPETRTMCLSIHSDPQRVAAAIDAGARGYLLKDCAFEELVQAVRLVLDDKVYLSPEIAGIVLEGYRGRRSHAKASSFSGLTTREREVLQLLAEGHATKDIACRLKVSPKTVGAHREHVMRKLEIHNIAELTRYAILEGLTSLELHRGSTLAS
jgi:DNA-binding NarL/FixJ family response regulator